MKVFNRWGAGRVGRGVGAGTGDTKQSGTSGLDCSEVFRRDFSLFHCFISMWRHEAHSKYARGRKWWEACSSSRVEGLAVAVEIFVVRF